MAFPGPLLALLKLLSLHAGQESAKYFKLFSFLLLCYMLVILMASKSALMIQSVVSFVEFQAPWQYSLLVTVLLPKLRSLI